MQMDMNSDHWSTLDHNPIILNDRIMTDAARPLLIHHDHGYFLTDEEEFDMLKVEDTKEVDDIKLEKDIVPDCFTDISPSSPEDFSQDNIIIKQEPVSPPPIISSLLNDPVQLSSAVPSQSLIKQPAFVLSSRNTSFTVGHQLIFPKIKIKTEGSSSFVLPPTPSSYSGSDSERSLSPLDICAIVPKTIPSVSSLPTSPTKKPSTPKFKTNASLISYQPRGATGALYLTEEEKRTLLAEGYSIPTELPLTKIEERALRKVRRKIKNKISAQESRRRKKEYLDSLEKRIDLLETERLELLQASKRQETRILSLQAELQRVQTFVKTKLECEVKPECCTASTQTDLILFVNNFDFKLDIDSLNNSDSR